MEDKNKIRLTAAEMSTLWSQYINDSLAVCVNKHFLEKVEDQDIKKHIEKVIQITTSNISTLEALFKREGFPIPVGFTEKDVDVQAPRLFSDTFVSMYLRQMSILAMAASGTALGLVTRPDVVEFHKRVLNEGVMMQDLTRDTMLNQGTYIKPPYITLPDKVDFVEKQQFLAGFFGKKRALTSVEITNLFINIQTNSIGKALMIGFAQTATDEDVKEYLKRGMKVAQKHIDIFGDFLRKEDLPAPMVWDSAVTDSTTTVFSDKLIMFHVSAMVAAGVGNYGVAMGASPRRDIGMKYASLIPEIALYAEDGANIMIKNGWLEEPPQADDREQLIQK
ncbi:DUF3231 family protein [Ferdinandcohnia sp. Marseille-Q9671]